MPCIKIETGLIGKPYALCLRTESIGKVSDTNGCLFMAFPDEAERYRVYLTESIK